MFEWFHTLFSPNDHPDITQSLIVLLIAISIGFFAGRIRVGNISLGVAAVMFVGLNFGTLWVSNGREYFSICS